MAATQAGNKRGRAAWEDTEDVSELKAHLSKQAEQIKKLTKDNGELKRALAGAEGKAPEQSEEELSQFANKLRKTIRQSIEAQMVYRRQANKSRVGTSLPNMTLDQVKAVVGECQAKSGPKQFEVKLDSAQLKDIFGYGSFCKSLRYGACLSLCDGLKFCFDKSSRELKVNGMYSMDK